MALIKALIKNRDMEAMLLEMIDRDLEGNDGKKIKIKRVKFLNVVGPRVYYTREGVFNQDGKTQIILSIQGFSFLRLLKDDKIKTRTDASSLS